jgi:hypothetical protein
MVVDREPYRWGGFGRNLKRGAPAELANRVCDGGLDKVVRHLPDDASFGVRCGRRRADSPEPWRVPRAVRPTGLGVVEEGLHRDFRSVTPKPVLSFSGP